MKKLFKYLKPYWFIALLSPLLMIGEVVVDLLQPDLMSDIVNIGIFGGDMDFILSTGLKMLILVIIGGAFGIACSYTATSASQRFGKDLRVDAYTKVMSLSAEQTDKFNICVDFSCLLLLFFIKFQPYFKVHLKHHILH